MCCVVEQMHDILARELMKKSRGLMAKYNKLVLKDEQVNLTIINTCVCGVVCVFVCTCMRVQTCVHGDNVY